MACWPTLRSSSATLVSSARFFPAPLNARSPCSCNSRRHRCRSLGCTSSARATSAAVCPLLSRFTAVCLNSLLNFLRDFIVRFTSFAEIYRLTGCLKNGVHSTSYRWLDLLCLPDELLHSLYCLPARAR